MSYEQRFIKNSKGNTEFLFFEDENKYTLSDILSENNKIVLLGNPGIGKSTELKLLFDILWELRENSLNIPFYINLKNFRTSSKFEDLILFEEWRELPAITFILDGLDEIANIQDFISELENFLERNKNKNINVVVSCRTNIYEKYLIKISGFKYFYLEGLTDKQINNILKKRIFKQLTLEELNKFRVYLENPFNLNLFCEYYESKKTYPETQSESWSLFIENELKKLSKEKLIKREEIIIPHIKKCLEKVAFTNELMQQNYIVEEDLYDLLGKEDKSVFEQISFIEKLPDSENYIFRHKNYQEFFSAKFLSELNSTEIISILNISPNVNKTKPSLFNTITFLLNIIDDDNKFNEIKKWLLKNEPEILFLAEKEKLDSNTQKEIFRNYFNEIAVKKTFWFGMDRRFSLDKIAEFADIDFLISIIKEDKHFRSVISALDVLAFTDDTGKDSQIKELLISIIFLEGRYVETALRTFKAKGFHKNDSTLFIKVAKHFEENYSPEVQHQIISMLFDFENIDDYFNILQNSLYKLYEIKPEKIKDNTIRGTEWILEKIFLKIQNSENFIHILDVIFNEKFAIKLSNFYDKKFKEKLIDKTLSFVESEDDFLFRIIDAFLRPKDNFIHRKDNFLITLINKSSRDIKAFKYIINKYGLTNKNYFIICLFDNKECIDYVAEKYKREELRVDKESDINGLRNRYFQTQSELGYYFEDVFKKAGYTFPETLPTQKEIDKNQKKYSDFVQQNFEILFDKDKLAQEVTNVFVENEVDKMTWKKIHDIEFEWYRKENYHGIQNSVFRAISNSVREFDKTKEGVILKIQDDYFILFQIKHKIKDRESEGFTVKPEHIEFIEKHCLKFAEEFNFDNVININEDDSFQLYKGFYILKMLYFFDKKYDMNYTQEFYLKTLKYCNVLNNADDNIYFIKDKVNDDTKFNQQIIHDLNNEALSINSLKDQIDYAIENKLTDSYQKISHAIVSNRYLYSQKDFLNRYVNLLSESEQLNFLKQCCSDTNSYLCWEAVNIFIDKSLDKDFILQISKQYLKTKEQEFISNALNVLFCYNDNQALDTYVTLLEYQKQIDDIDLKKDYVLKDIYKFNNINNIEVIESIFGIIYDENLGENTVFYYTRQNFQSLISNFSREERGFKEVQNILRRIRLNVSDNDHKFFYINNLIDTSQLSYYNSLSKTFDFKEAKEYIKNIESPVNSNSVVMGDQINISGGTFQNSQIGGKGNFMNNYLNNEDVIKAEELLKEFEELKIENEEWKNIFMEGVKDLLDLKKSENEEKEKESKTKIKKVYDFISEVGKKVNDLKNLAFLPVELQDKVPKLIELGKHLSKLIA